MHVMRAADVIAGDADRLYRHSRGQAIAVVVCGGLAAGALAWVGIRGGHWVAVYLAGLILLGLLVLRRFVTARFRPSNWLVRQNDEGLFIQLRSYLNHHFTPDDRTVAFVPYGEIRSARSVRERTELPGRNGEAHTVRVRRLVELEVTGSADPLAEAVAAEIDRMASRRMGLARTIYRHVPVRRVAPTRIEVEWGGVGPAARAFLATLPASIAIEPPIDSNNDLARLRHAGRPEQEAYVMRLADTGRVIDAIAAARLLFGWDLEAARTFVRREVAPGRPAPPGPAPR
jgi:hypothetical protein